MKKPSKTIKKKKTSSKKIFKDYKKPFIYVTLLICMTLAGYFIVFSKAASNVITGSCTAPCMSLSPVSQTLAAGETFTVQLRANSGTTNFDVAAADIMYPANLVDYVSTSQTGSAFSTVGSSGVDTTAGRIRLTKFNNVNGNLASVKGDVLIATYTFKAKTPNAGGNAVFSFRNVANETNDTGMVVNVSGTNLITSNLSNAFGATYKIDTIAPTVSVTAPIANANVEYGTSLTINANAADAESSVAKVEFLVDGTLVSTDTASPWTYTWPSTGAAQGNHTVTARATDAYNNVATSSAVAFNVRDTSAPTTSLTTPTANAVLKGTAATITASASDGAGTGISKVEFYNGATLIGSDNTSPYSITWNTTTVSYGTYSLTAKAYDNATTANVTTSAAVSVTVDNRDLTPPTQPANFRVTGVTKTSVSLAWNASTDASGISSYVVTRNGSQVYSGTALAFTDSNGLTEGTTYNYSIIAKDGASPSNSSTAATVSATTQTTLVGDYDLDNDVDIIDLSTFLSDWGSTNARSNFNKTGTSASKVDIFDLSMILTNWTGPL